MRLPTHHSLRPRLVSLILSFSLPLSCPSFSRPSPSPPPPTATWLRCTKLKTFIADTTLLKDKGGLPIVRALANATGLENLDLNYNEMSKKVPPAASALRLAASPVCSAPLI